MSSKESYRTSEETSYAQFLDKTLHYLETYLDPDRSWRKETHPKQRINEIRYAHVDWKAISNHIKNMSYRHFLKTPYWQAIAAHVKYRAKYRCQVCNSGDSLVAHHRDYGIHGFEHAYMQELIALCSSCHSTFHGTKDKTPLSKSKIKTLKMILRILSILFVYFLISA